MTKVDIISGFLGAGKTTFIKKLIEDVFPGERLVLIENEFGEIGIDGGFLKDAGVEITEMNSGCICCTLVGDFSKALQKVLVDYTPDRVIIEPSGVGKLSDVVKAIEGVKDEADIEIDGRITVVDGKKAKIDPFLLHQCVLDKCCFSTVQKSCTDIYRCCHRRLLLLDME